MPCSLKIGELDPLISQWKTTVVAHLPYVPLPSEVLSNPRKFVHKSPEAVWSNKHLDLVATVGKVHTLFPSLSVSGTLVREAAGQLVLSHKFLSGLSRTAGERGCPFSHVDFSSLILILLYYVEKRPFLIVS